MKIQNYNPKEVETEILSFWDEHGIYKKSRKAGREKFYYLDGPPYTSGRIHLGQAWGKALRDMVMRYKRMAGFDVWDRPGFDMHGMPTEHKTMAKLGLKFKDDIPKHGLDKFSIECANLSTENMNTMIDDFKRLGIWMDWENPYIPLKQSFIEGIWWLIKKAHTDGRLYEGEKSMHWCWDCGTSLSKHELEYKEVMEDSIFVKFPIKARPKEYLIIWTTTPWTIAFNLGIMANPELEYVRCQVEDEVWILAKGLAGPVIQAVAEKRFSVIEEFTGDKLEGLEYEHPFYDELKEHYDRLKSMSKKVHTVVMSSEYVTLDAGSGLVHMAPGCGPEDYEIGYKNGIPPFNTLDQYGFYPDGMGGFSGLHAKKQNKQFTEALRARNVLIAETPVSHEYAHCWRCHQPVIFRTTKQWFFRVEDLKEEMRAKNKEVLWVPDWAGERQFDSWLANLRDNSITRQNYWGTPAPIWVCDKCHHVEVVATVDELKKFAGHVPENLHKPWIDDVCWKHSCGGMMTRVPDVLDVWIDAGTTSWTCLDFPQTKEHFNRLFPADFILEGKDQIRGWFNLLLIASMLGFKKHPYKAVYMHGFINDALGRKMSKSQGNYILPHEYIEKYGADTLRCYMIGAANPGFDLNFNEDDLQVRSKNLLVLWNVHKYILEYAKELGTTVDSLKGHRSKDEFEVLERFMLSKTNTTLKHVTELYDSYRLNEVPTAIEDLYLSLSRTYIQLMREKLVSGTDEEKQNAMYAMYHALMVTLKIMYPLAPMVCERMYQNVKECLGLKEESISSFNWPAYDERLMDRPLEHSVTIMNSVVQSALSAREKAQRGVRWPLPELIIVTEDAKTVEAVESLRNHILSQLNVKNIVVTRSFSKVRTSLRADFSKMGPDLGEATPKIIARLTMESAETILQSMAKQGKFVMKVDGKEYNIVREYVMVDRVVPQPYIEVEFRSGFAYVNTQMDEILEAEGYAREVIRRIQQARKSAELERSDKISLFIKTDPDLALKLKRHEATIREKTAAKIMTISSNDPAKAHVHSFTEKVKDRGVWIFFNKI